MQKSKLAAAISMTVAGLALSSAASAQVTTMYNLTTGQNGSVTNNTSTADPIAAGVWAPAFKGKTDGWTNGGATSTGVGTVAAQSWAGTTTGLANDISTANPFGYAGAHMNWGFGITGGNGGTGTISTYDAKARYNIYADIDTAQGAWSDAALGGASGWFHDLDVGLFKSDTTGLVTLTATGLINTGTNFGFTIFKGMDAATDWGHHGGWNAGNNTQVGAPNADSSPYNSFSLQAGTGLLPADIVAYSVGGATPSGLNSIQFNAVAGQTYTIFLGGYRNGGWYSTTDGYSLTISQVPVPGAVWLFGSAMAGLIGFGGRRKSVAA